MGVVIKSVFKILPAAVGLFIASTMMPAQELPSLQKDAAVTAGELANVISYYLVTSSEMKGMADFALVRKGSGDTLAARKDLSELPRFNKTAPYKFLARKGIGCRPEGYITYNEDAAVFRFDNVPVIESAAADSTLLMLFDIIAERPYNHAIIVAGDITPSDIIQKMKVFELMVPSRSPSYKPAAYTWVPGQETKFSFIPSEETSVTMTFRSPRTHDSQMSTIIPFISETYSLELARIVKDRLEDAFLARDIPVSGLDVRCVGSLETPGDETFTVRITTSRDQILQASMALASTLSSLNSTGATAEEYITAKSLVTGAKLEGQSNDELVRQCIAAYLYGGDLASSVTKAKFMVSRNTNTENEVILFNNYVSALIHDGNSAEVVWTGHEEDYDEWTNNAAFTGTWNGVALLPNSTTLWTSKAGDTTRFLSGKSAVKIKNTAEEHVSGGEIWTFANGIRVIYKKTASNGSFNYSMMIKGGYTSAKGLSDGEGAFFSDMLWLYDIAGMSGKNFLRVLAANGVRMENRVSVSEMSISGSAPSNRLSLVLKALMTVANDRKINAEAFEAYSTQERAQLGGKASLDSLMYTGYPYTSVKRCSGLLPTTVYLADSYYSNQFSRVSDGVIMITGDMPKEEAQRQLSSYLGGFRVTKTSSVRPVVQYKLPSGNVTYAEHGGQAGFTIAMAAARPFTVENNMAFRTAVIALNHALSGSMTGYGFSVSVSERFKLYPQESVECIFTFTPAPESGLPEGVKGGADVLDEAVVEARKTIAKVLEYSVSASELSTCKSLLLNEYATMLADPELYQEAVLLRYSNSKDVVTKYKERIENVSADKIKETFEALGKGRRVEYVVRP